jgi:hypothetical protein
MSTAQDFIDQVVRRTQAIRIATDKLIKQKDDEEEYEWCYGTPGQGGE